jgi:subtilisin family serine protease
VFDEETRPEHPDAVFVTAAGNDSTDDPFYPARYDWAVGVGAATRDGQTRAGYSNFGGNVDVWAPGDHVNAFIRGNYRMLDGSRPRFTTGLARWMGTSFATPLVSGHVARRVIETGDAPSAALAAVLASATHSIDGKPALFT